MSRGNNFKVGYRFSFLLFTLALCLSIAAHIFTSPRQYEYDEKNRNFITRDK